jgi:hypothetical protein
MSNQSDLFLTYARARVRVRLIVRAHGRVRTYTIASKMVGPVGQAALGLDLGWTGGWTEVGQNT